MNKRKLIALHTLFWLVLFIKTAFLGLDAAGLFIIPKPAIGWGLHIAITLSYFTISMGTFYCSALMVSRLLMPDTKWYQKLLFGLSILAAPVLIRAIVEFGFLKPVIGFDNYAVNRKFSWQYFVPNVIFYYWDMTIFGAAYATFMHWRKTEKQKQQQEAMHKTAELDFLRSQLNPHFLFNSINDIYALVIKKSDDAPEAIMQLSGLLRYALYESNHTEVPLEKELTYIQNYLDLQRIGYEGNFFVSMTIKGDIQHHLIAPMLLLPFIENACKHGITFDRTFPVKVSLVVTGNKLHFEVINSITNAQKDRTGGIGLENIRKRLTLLYPGKQQLEISNQNNLFIASLTIER